MTTLAPITTFIFATPGALHGPLSLGVGRHREEALADAIARHAHRYAAHQVASCPDLTTHLEALKSGTAQVTCRLRDAYPSPERMGHSYMSFESETAAVAFGSCAEMQAIAERLASDASVVTLRDALTPHLHRYCRGVDRALIDWYEVRDELLGDARERLARRERQSQTVQRGAAATPPEEVAAPAQAAVLHLPSAASVKPRQIDQQVLEVLAACRAEGPLVFLPPQRLDAKLYARVNEVLVALGGRWNTRLKAHRLEEDAQPVLEVVVATGTFTKPQDFGYFPTPRDLAERVVALAQIEPGMRVLEPSAGQGALALPAAQAAGSLDLVYVVEMLPANIRALRAHGFNRIHEGDFLDMEPEPLFDRVVLNPPFSGLADISHLLHAVRFLAPTGRLVAITSPAWQAHSTRRAAEFREFAQDCEAEVEDVAAGAFAKSGTQVATRIVSIDAPNLPWYRQAERPRMRA